MKKLIISFFLVVCFISIPYNVMSYPVNILSSEFKITGNYSMWDAVCDEEDNIITMNWNGYFEESFSNPLNRSISEQTSDPWYPMDVHVHSSTDYFSVSSYASASSSQSEALSTAYAVFVFNPSVQFDQLTINYSKDIYDKVTLQLIDLTTSQQLFSLNLEMLDNFDHIGMNETETINCNFLSDHIYKLNFYVASSANDDFYSAYIYTNDLTPVFVSIPESSTIFLLVFGLLGLVVPIRRKICMK